MIGSIGLDVPTAVDQGLVLRVWDWSETSQTALVFGRERGMVRVLAKGSKRPRSSFSGGLEPLTRGELTVLSKAGSELSGLTSWDLQELFPELRQRLACFYAGAAVVEMLEAGVTDHDPHPRLFDSAVAGLRALGTAGPVGVVVRVAWDVLVEGGYRPELDRDVVRGSGLEKAASYAFVPALGGFTVDTAEATIGGHAVWRTRSDTVEFLRAIASDQWGAENIAETSGECETIMRAGRLLTQLLREVLGRDFPSVRHLLLGRDGTSSGR